MSASISFAVAEAQVQEAWIARYNDDRPSSTNQAVAMAVCQDSGIVVAGSSTSTNRDYDYVVLKFSSSGALVWSSRYASSNSQNDTLRGMAVDQEGNVLITGTSVTIKYNSEGTQLWTAALSGRALTTDSNDNAYVTGFSELDFATAKLSPTGSNLWVRAYDRAGLADISQTITLDSSGNVCIAGIAIWRHDRGGDYREFAVVKYDNAGTLLWTNGFPPWSGGAIGTAVKALKSDSSGNVYVTGSLTGWDLWYYFTTKLSPGGTSVFSYRPCCSPSPKVHDMRVDESGVYLTGRGLGGVYNTVKLSLDGQELWSREYGEFLLLDHVATALDVTVNGGVVVTGLSPRTNHVSDIATVRYSSNGNQLWAQRYGEPNLREEGKAIAVDANGNIYVAGTSQNTNGGTDIILIKYVEMQQIQVLTNQQVLLQFSGTVGQTYRFQSSSNLMDWVELGSAVCDSNCVYRFLDTNPPAVPCRFYRSVGP